MDIVSQTVQSLLDDTRISKTAMRVWLEVARSPQEGDKQGYPIHKMSIALMTRKLKCSRNAVYMAIKHLQHGGYLQQFWVGGEKYFILRHGNAKAG